MNDNFSNKTQLSGEEKMIVRVVLIISISLVCIFGFLAHCKREDRVNSLKSIKLHKEKIESLIDKGYSPLEAKCAYSDDDELCKTYIMLNQNKK